MCLTCFPNSFLAAGICTSCVSPCLSCLETNPTSCLSCPKGFLLNNNTCLENQCPLYCEVCSSNVTCTQCQEGFVPINGFCSPCLVGCAECSTESPGLCLQCSLGTYLDPNSSKCIGCSPNCVTCLPDGCMTCLTGFYLTADLTCAPNCVAPCETCSETDPTSCLSCAVGYTFNTAAVQNCQEDLSCNSTVSCTVCPFGFVLISQQCFACNSNCARCETTDPNLCTSCLVGQFLDTTDTTAVCANCPSGCDECLSSTVCLSCADGFTSITDASEDSPVQCRACRSPCLTCAGTQRRCVTCVPGYTLTNGKCLSNFNYGFNVTFSVNPADFYLVYDTVLEQLGAAVGDDYGAVGIDSILQGSTIVNGQIATTASPGTSTSQTQFSNVQNLLGTSSNIAGLSVIASSVTANGGDPNTA